MYARRWSSLRCSTSTHGASSIPASFAASIRPWPAITRPAPSISTGDTKPKASRLRRSFSSCSGGWVLALFS